MNTPSKRKNIILLSDGTGNSASAVWRTNVWRLFESLYLAESEQVAFYGDGVGTSSFKPLAILGSAFGWGLKRNVLDLYRFLCRNYKTPGEADIYVFGFSRGAFTVRVLTELVVNQGLVPYRSESELHRQAVAAYRAYRRERHHSVFHVESVFRAIRDVAIAAWNLILRRPGYDRSANLEVPEIRFLGVWDTVAAYGLPIEEMTRGVSQWLWPLELPDRTLSPKVRRARHALALDDERTTFHPVLWTERDEEAVKPDDEGRRWLRDERLSQVWFPGVHANVGGGYPDDSLAQVALWWMMSEAEICGLRFKASPRADPDAMRRAKSAADKDGRLYDSRHGLAGYYRYGPRKIKDLSDMRLSRRADDEVTVKVPKIHESAIERIINGAHAYAPIGFPDRYAVVTWDGELVDPNPYETDAHAAARAKAQEQVWDLVWWRRVVYFTTVAASSYLALFPLLVQTDRAAEFSSPLRAVSGAIRIGGAFLPGFAGWWIDAFAANPGRFLLGGLVVAGLIGLGVALGRRITDQMRTIWTTILHEQRQPVGTLPEGWVYPLRTSPLYRWLLGVMKRHVVPLISVLGLLYVGVALASHAVFDVADVAGAFCQESPRAALQHLRPREGRKEVATRFDPRSICWATGFELEEGRRYRITVSDPTGWRDRIHDANLAGVEIGELPDWTARVRLFSAIPLRRVLNRPWFRPIARIGAVGADEYPLDPEGPTSVRQQTTTELTADIRARRSGELFLYVNDAVIGLPRLTDHFYRNNSGEARVFVERLGIR